MPFFTKKVYNSLFLKKQQNRSNAEQSIFSRQLLLRAYYSKITNQKTREKNNNALGVCTFKVVMFSFDAAIKSSYCSRVRLLSHRILPTVSVWLVYSHTSFLIASDNYEHHCAFRWIQRNILILKKKKKIGIWKNNTNSVWPKE